MTTRRKALSSCAKVAGLLVATGMLPDVALAQVSAINAKAFDTKTMADLMKALGASAPIESKEVSVTGPDIAENGAVVPIGAATTLTGVKRLLIMVEKNPAILSAMFDVSDAIDSNFTTRVKMGQSSNVYAVALMNDGKAFFAQREVKVTLGGCGG